MRGAASALLWAPLAGLWACSEYQVKKGEDRSPVAPPGAEDPDDFGAAPDWNDCPTGYLGRYYNLPADHPDLEPGDGAESALIDPNLVDWWDEERLSFERFDPSLDQGGGWWPVDEGLAADPDYFSARWTAWIRVNEAQPVELLVGATTDIFVFVDDELLFAETGREDFEPHVVALDLPTGQLPLEFRFAQRMGDSALRARFLSEHVAVCYPDFSD